MLQLAKNVCFLELSSPNFRLGFVLGVVQVDNLAHQLLSGFWMKGKVHSRFGTLP